MSQNKQATSSKTAADAIACIKQADELLQEAVNENEQLNSKVASLVDGDEQFVSAIKQHIEKLASTKSPRSGKPCLTEAQKIAWFEYMDSPLNTKTAAAHLISELIDNYVVSEKAGEQTKNASEVGDVADMPGEKRASERPESIHPTARY